MAALTTHIRYSKAQGTPQTRRSFSLTILASPGPFDDWQLSKLDRRKADSGSWARQTRLVSGNARKTLLLANSGSLTQRAGAILKRECVGCLITNHARNHVDQGLSRCRISKKLGGMVGEDDSDEIGEGRTRRAA